MFSLMFIKNLKIRITKNKPRGCFVTYTCGMTTKGTSTYQLLLAIALGVRIVS